MKGILAAKKSRLTTREMLERFYSYLNYFMLLKFAHYQKKWKIRLMRLQFGNVEKC